MVVAAMAVIAGCSRQRPDAAEMRESSGTPSQRVTLPGFSVDAPTGEVVDHSESPSGGKYHVKLPRASLARHLLQDIVQNSEFIVSWSAQTSTHEEWQRAYLPLYTRAMQAVIPDARVMHSEVLDEARWFSVVGNDRAPVAFGVVNCEPRFGIDITFSRYHVLEQQLALMRRTLKSVRCEVKEENRALLEPTLRLPESFGTVSGDGGLQFHSLNGEVLVTNFTSGEMTPEWMPRRAAFHAVLFAMDQKVELTEVVEVPATRKQRNRSERMIKAPLPTLRMTAYIGSLFCKNDSVTLIFIWLPPKPSDSQAWERFAQVDCPGGESIPLPTYESLLSRQFPGKSAPAPTR